MCSRTMQVSPPSGKCLLAIGGWHSHTQANKRSAADGVLLAAGVESEGIVNGISVMISAGFSVVDEPYLRGLLTAIRAHLLQVCSNTQLGHCSPHTSLQHQCWLTLRACSLKAVSCRTYETRHAFTCRRLPCSWASWTSWDCWSMGRSSSRSTAALCWTPQKW